MHMCSELHNVEANLEAGKLFLGGGGNLDCIHLLLEGVYMVDFLGRLQAYSKEYGYEREVARQPAETPGNCCTTACCFSALVVH